MIGKAGLKKAATKTAMKNAAKNVGKQALSAAGEEAKSTLKDKAINTGLGALDVLSGGADEEEDGSWSSKLANWGGTAGNIAGGLAGGAAGSIVPVAGNIAGGLAGGAAGGFLGRKAGKMLGGIIDKFSGGDKQGAVKSLAKLIATGAIPAYGLAKFSGMLDDDESETYSDLLSATKSKIPDKYEDEIEDAIDASED